MPPVLPCHAQTAADIQEMAQHNAEIWKAIVNNSLPLTVKELLMQATALTQLAERLKELT